jgi:hypothetical protein
MRAHFARMICFALINRMPEKGLEETFESLRDLYETYARPAPAPLLPQTFRTVIAKRGAVYPRPHFHVEDEE